MGYELVGRYALRTLIFVVSISERVTIDKLDSHQIFESFTITPMPQIPPVLNVSTFHIILIFSQEPLFPKEQFKVENDWHCNEAQPKPENTVAA